MKDSDLHGVVAVDKLEGPTSHDVVFRARKLLQTRRIGHAGTLDPMATGVLVILVGEATKLGPYLTAHQKRYVARVAFGLSTDTLDAQGTATATAEVPDGLKREIADATAGDRLEAALASERARTSQVPPAYSAIQVDGRRSYDLARSGEAVVLPARHVEVTTMTIVGRGVPEAPALPFVDVALDVSKGYYVRSFARDLGDLLGVPAHLSALRRTASGPFTIENAILLDAGRDAVVSSLIPLATAAAAALPTGILSPEGALRVRHGKPLTAADFESAPPYGGASAWLDGAGRLVAVGGRSAGESSDGDGAMEAERFVIHRGFLA